MTEVKLKNLMRYIRFGNWYGIKRWFRLFRQRVIRGWDDSETWSMYVTFANFMIPRLERFKEIRGNVPLGMTDEEWEVAIQKMIDYLRMETEEIEYDREKYHEYREVFSTYFKDLWW